MSLSLIDLRSWLSINYECTFLQQKTESQYQFLQYYFLKTHYCIEFRSHQEVFANDLLNRIKLLTDKSHQLEQKQSVLAAQTSTNIAFRPDISSREVLLEQTVKNLEHKVRSLNDQLINLQSTNARYERPDFSSYDLKMDTLGKNYQNLYSDLNTAKHAYAQAKADTKLALLENDQATKNTLNSLEKSTQSIVNQVNDKIDHLDDELRSELRKSINRLSLELEAQLKDYASANNNLRHDLTMKIDSIHTYSVERYQALNSTISEEKRRITTLLAQNEAAIKEMESFIRQSQKATDKLIFAEITKREKNSKMIQQLDKGIKEICVELDTRLKHFEDTTENSLKKLHADVKKEMAQTFENLSLKILGHDKEFETINSLLGTKFTEVTEICNKNIGVFASQLQEQLETVKTQISDQEISVAKENTKILSRIDS